MVKRFWTKQNKNINLESFEVGEKKAARQCLNDRKSEKKTVVHDEWWNNSVTDLQSLERVQKVDTLLAYCKHFWE